MKIAFIGAGNMATNLSLIFKEAGHEIVQIVSKTASSASALAKVTQCSFTADINELDTHTDFCFICVSDDAIPDVVHNMPTIRGTVLHTSGSTSMDVFQNRFENYGVFYPLQSFSRFKKSDLTDVTIFVEANNKENEGKIKLFASQYSEKILITNSGQRMAVHICGVFANNFTNHMYVLSHKLAKKHNLPFEVFFPLIKETAEKIRHRSPTASQTGPAARKDITILEKHRDFLKSDPELQEMYNLISESIIKFSQSRIND